MELSYTIKKQAGNYKPILILSFQYEQWEIDLRPDPNPSGIIIDGNNVLFPEPPTTDLSKPVTREIELQFRPQGKSYQDIDRLVRKVMRVWEQRVKDAIKSKSVKKKVTVGHREKYKRYIAPYVIAKKLQSAKKKEGQLRCDDCKTDTLHVQRAKSDSFLTCDLCGCNTSGYGALPQ